MFEYIEDNPATWTFQKLPDIPEWFERELVRLAGLNRHGRPNLRVVKGNEVKTESAEHGGLKYHAGYAPPKTVGFEYVDNGERFFVKDESEVPAGKILAPVIEQEELGLLRYVIEKWTSPEELEAQNRFKQRYGQGDINATLRTFPREGVYDTYYIVESFDESFRELDERLMTYLKFRWRFENENSAGERETVIKRLAEAETSARQKAKAEIMDGVLAGDIRLPQEEIERREEYWRTQHNYYEDAMRGVRVAGL